MACATTDYISASNNTQTTPPASNPNPGTDTPAPINTDLPAPVINETPTPIKQTDTPTQEVKGVSTGTKIAAISPTPTIEPGINPNPIINPPPTPGESCEDAPSEAFLRQYGVDFRILHNAVLVKNQGPKCFRFTLKGHDVVTGNLYPFGEQVLKQTKVFTVSAGVTAIITLDQAPLPCSFQTDLFLGDKTGINEGTIAYDFMEHKCVNPPTGKLTCAPANQNGQVGQPVAFTATNGSLPIWTAPGGQPIGGRGSNFQTTYDTAGTHTVTVQSNGQIATCTVNIGTTQGQTLTCAPANQTVAVGATANFTATGGSGTYTWDTTGDNPTKPPTGASASFTFGASGEYTVNVHSGTATASCRVSVTTSSGTLTCSPSTQNVSVGQTARFTASGSGGGTSITYSWTSPNGSPTGGSGVSYQTSYASAGTYVVTVRDGSVTANCQVVVTQGQALTCSPQTQTTTINTTIQFSAAGGNGTYAWLATDGTPATGTTANFATKFATPTRGIAAKQVKVTSGGVDAFCYVTVNDVTVNQEQADLAIVKTASNSSPVINTNFTYTIVITNLGPNNATGISVRDQLPTGITLVAVHEGSPSQGTFNTSDGVWTVGALNVGRNATLLLNVRATQTGSIANTASITASSLPDPVTSNNQSTATVNVSGGGGGGGGTTYDVGVAKSASTLTPTVGQNVSFTITATNFSSNSVTNVTIRDTLPSQVTYVSHTQSVGSYNQGTGIWTVGSMNSGAQATLSIIATVNTSGSITNTTTVNSLDQSDSNSSNNQASVTLVASTGGGGGGGGSSLDLAVTKSVNNSAPTLGSNVVFTLTVFNNGPLAATNVTLRDQLPSGLVYVSSNPSQGSYNQATGIWTVGSLPVSTSANLQLTVTVNQAGTTTNTGQVNSLDQSDSNSSNNSASSSVTVSTGSGTGADIGVTKSVNTDRPVVGSQIVFTINAVNYGPQAATGVTLTDLLPSQVTFVKYQATSGTYDRTNGVWNIGSMASGASAVLQITATVVKQDNFTNIVRVTTSSPTDPNTTNNQAQVTVTSTQAPGLPAAGFNTAAPIVIGFLFIFLALAVKFMGSTPKQLVATGDDKNIQTFTRFD